MSFKKTLEPYASAWRAIVELEAAPYVSASQESTWLDCPRKWAYSRGRERTDTEQTSFGKRVHTIAELWLRDGVPPDPRSKEGKCLLSGIEHLPMPGTCLVEQPLDFVWPPPIECDCSRAAEDTDHEPCEHEADSVRYIGQSDFVVPPAYDTVLVGDHKTTGDLCWAKTEDELANDPQAIVYSHWAAETFDATYVEARWVYYRRDGRGSRKVSITAHRDAIRERFEDLHRRVALPIIQAHGVPPELFPRAPTDEPCSKYSGCPYRTECWHGVDPVILAERALNGEAMTTQPDMQMLLAQLKANVTAAQAPALPGHIAELVQPPEPVKPTLEEPITAEAFAKFRAMLAAQAPTGPQTTPPIVEVVPVAPPAPVLTTDPRTPEQQAPRRKRRTKAEIEAAKAAAQEPLVIESAPAPEAWPATDPDVLALLCACASAGLEPDAASAYIDLLRGAA